MLNKFGIAACLFVLLAAMIAISPAYAEQSCADKCNSRGGLTTGQQKQKCISQCEDAHAGRK
jgi:hypothetical protein